MHWSNRNRLVVAAFFSNEEIVQREIVMADHRIETRDRAAEARKHPIEIDPGRARGGQPGIPVLYVLVTGTVLVIAAFLIVYFVIQPHGIFTAHLVTSGSSAMHRHVASL